MGDAIQRLLDEARPVVERWKREADSWSWTMGWIVEMFDALEAAQRQEATVRASTLRDAADAWHAENAGTSPRVHGWLWARADQIEKGVE